MQENTGAAIESIEGPEIIKNELAADSPPLTYSSIMEEASKPVTDRKLISNPRLNRNVQPRRFHLTEKQVDKVKARAEKLGASFPNPYSRGGAYYGFVQALIEMGVDQWHNFDTTRDKMKEILSSIYNSGEENAWDKFANRGCRNSTTGKDLYGRILQNAAVLQRIETVPHTTSKVGNATPYGMKLQQLNACIDIQKDAAGNVAFRINTIFSSPKDVVPLKGLNTRKRKS